MPIRRVSVFAVAVVCAASGLGILLARQFAASLREEAPRTAHLPNGQPSVPRDNPQQLLSGTRGPVQIVRFTLYDVGIFPREARASAGIVAIQMQDLSGDSAGLVVQSEASQILGQVVRAQGQWRAKTRLTLSPGRYQVYDASRPRNKATLIIEP